MCLQFRRNQILHGRTNSLQTLSLMPPPLPPSYHYPGNNFRNPLRHRLYPCHNAPVLASRHQPIRIIEVVVVEHPHIGQQLHRQLQVVQRSHIAFRILFAGTSCPPFETRIMTRISEISAAAIPMEQSTTRYPAASSDLRNSTLSPTGSENTVSKTKLSHSRNSSRRIPPERG